MIGWDVYEARNNARGGTLRGSQLQREKQYLKRHFGDSLSYHNVLVDGMEQNVTIINTDNLDEKVVISQPDEVLKCGAIIYWMDTHWVITEKDYNTEIYTKCKMVQCNYLLKWVSEDAVIHEQWCVVSDGTKLRRLSFRIE